MSADFVAHMEDVLDLYAEPYDPARPVVCLDETSTQLLADARPPIPAKPGRPRREDYEYVRGGTRNLFLTCEPLAGWRHVEVTERRTKVDFAHQMRWLVEEAYPEAEVIRVVLDNLNTHRKASLYEAFLVFNVNYFCRLASIILAGSPPYPAPAAGPPRSGSWGHRIPG